MCDVLYNPVHRAGKQPRRHDTCTSQGQSKGLGEWAGCYVHAYHSALVVLFGWV